MSKTILVVDDPASICSVVGVALRGAGYYVIEACGGKDALSKLTGERIHLIISDVIGGSNGFTIHALTPTACPSITFDFSDSVVSM